MPETLHRTWAEIDRGALRHNVQALRTRLPAGVEIMAVVKANAYGHGLSLVAPALAGVVEQLGVANLEEAEKLQSLGPGVPISLLSPCLPGERAAVVRAGFRPSISNLAEAQAYDAVAREAGLVAPVHLIIDTGMGRIGTWQAEAPEFLQGVRALAGLRIVGVASHLPMADEDEAYTREQLQRFAQIVAAARADGLTGFAAHAENSAGALGFPSAAGDLVRAGLLLYGSSPLPEWQGLLRQVVTWKTRITLLREVGPDRGISYGRTFITEKNTRIATLAIGYADGYRRHLNGRGAEVLIRGRRCPVLGRVTMDQILVDVSAVPSLEVGEEVVLLGRQGGEEILAAEMATKAGTIAWDIFTGLGARVARVPVR